MTTVTLDVSYGTRPVPLRLPYLSVRRRSATGRTARRARRSPRPVAAPPTRWADAAAAREAAFTRLLALRAGAGV